MNHPGPDSYEGTFPTTQWSVVLDAGASETGIAAAALEKLCRRYWYPVYAFVRRHGHDVPGAEDLTQGFFAFVLERKAFHRADPQRGRFRSFLLASLTHYLHNEHDRAQTLKRGGSLKLVSLDQPGAEELYGRETADHATPEKMFERQWAALLVRRVLDRLEEEHNQRGQSALFLCLQPCLTGCPDTGSCARTAHQLGMTDGAVKVALHRARRRFGELLRHEVAHTVSRPEDVEDEIRHLLAAIAE
ncbi:MAG: sigma-70 family RNA polymerase sigma factor [Kiritimatiellales bacterium]|nr:sigma-70 family RNA polymerase sigma factor [Kiritimatiellales bacterium]